MNDHWQQLDAVESSYSIYNETLHNKHYTIIICIVSYILRYTCTHVYSILHMCTSMYCKYTFHEYVSIH